jgi:hypothetical protein
MIPSNSTLIDRYMTTLRRFVEAKARVESVRAQGLIVGLLQAELSLAEADGDLRSLESSIVCDALLVLRLLQGQLPGLVDEFLGLDTIRASQQALARDLDIVADAVVASRSRSRG